MKIYELRENGALKDPRLAYRSMVELGFRITWLSPAVAPVVMANQMMVSLAIRDQTSTMKHIPTMCNVDC